MQFRVTAALVAIFALLAGGVSYFGLSGPVAKTTPTVQNTVFDLPATDVTRVAVVEGGKTAAVERRDDGSWQIVAPTTEPADGPRIDDAVSRLAKLSASRKLEGATDLAAYGLAQPSAEIELTMKDGTTRGLLVGGQTPDSSSYYVKPADASAVYVVPTFTIGDLTGWLTEPPRPRPIPTLAPLPNAPAEATKPAG
jgi:Domain of unknown function (DUF4340)